MVETIKTKLDNGFVVEWKRQDNDRSPDSDPHIKELRARIKHNYNQICMIDSENGLYIRDFVDYEINQAGAILIGDDRTGKNFTILELVSSDKIEKSYKYPDNKAAIKKIISSCDGYLQHLRSTHKKRAQIQSEAEDALLRARVRSPSSPGGWTTSSTDTETTMAPNSSDAFLSDITRMIRRENHTAWSNRDSMMIGASYAVPFAEETAFGTTNPRPIGRVVGTSNIAGNTIVALDESEDTFDGEYEASVNEDGEQ